MVTTVGAADTTAEGFSGFLQGAGKFVTSVVGDVGAVGGLLVDGLIASYNEPAVIVVNASGSSPNFVPPTNPPSTPAIPDGWVGTPAANGNGTVYSPAGGGDGETIRVMGPTAQYPDGYWVQTNRYGQPVNPATGNPGPPQDTHVPLPPSGG
jgi:hypothetical protein